MKEHEVRHFPNSSLFFNLQFSHGMQKGEEVAK